MNKLIEGIEGLFRQEKEPGNPGPQRHIRLHPSRKRPRLTTKDGERLFKKVKAKVFAPGNEKYFTREQRCPPGKGFTEDGITGWLKHVADAIEAQWPNHEYRMVEIGPASFNFVWVREIEPLAEAASA